MDVGSIIEHQDTTIPQSVLLQGLHVARPLHGDLHLLPVLIDVLEPLDHAVSVLAIRIVLGLHLFDPAGQHTPEDICLVTSTTDLVPSTLAGGICNGEAQHTDHRTDRQTPNV